MHQVGKKEREESLQEKSCKEKEKYKYFWSK